MQYFVSIENNFYHHWQIQLLIESFKIHGVEDDLVIGIANSKNQGYGKSSTNLFNHKNKFSHSNLGDDKNYLPLNKLYSLNLALSNGMLKQPFTLLHPDMLLYRPILKTNYNIEFQNNSDNNQALYHISNHIKEEYKLNWIGMGETMVFNNNPMSLFKETFDILKELIEVYGRSQKLERAAWFYSVIKHFKGEIPLTMNPLELEMTLLHPNEGPIIHYKHGIPNYFNKLNFDSRKNLNLSEAESLSTLFDNQNPTAVTNYMKEIIKKAGI